MGGLGRRASWELGLAGEDLGGCLYRHRTSSPACHVSGYSYSFDPIALFVPAATANNTFKVSLRSNYTLENDIDRIFATPELRAAVADYQSNKPIKITCAESCRGTCRGKIRILGMVGGCKTISESRDWAKESAQRPEPLQVFKNNSITATFLNVTFNAYRYRRGIFDGFLNVVNDV